MGELYVEWWMFIVVMALGQFSPGPDMILLTKVALSDGLKSGCATAAGIATGLMVHAGLAIFFVDLITSLSGHSILLGIYILAVIYLLWLVMGLFQSAFIGYYSGGGLELNSDQGAKDLCLARHYWRGLLCNILNVKVAIFLAGVVLPFQQMAPDSTGWAMTLWLTIVVEGLLLWCLWVRVLQTGKIRNWYSRNYHIIDGMFGMALLVIVVFLCREILSSW